MPSRLDLECKKGPVSIQYKDKVTAASLHILVFYCFTSLPAPLHTFLTHTHTLSLSLFFSLCHVPLLSNCLCTFVFLLFFLPGVVMNMWKIGNAAQKLHSRSEISSRRVETVWPLLVMMAMKKDSSRDSAACLIESTEQIAEDRDFRQSVLYIYIYVYDLGKSAQCPFSPQMVDEIARDRNNGLRLSQHSGDTPFWQNLRRLVATSFLLSLTTRKRDCFSSRH